MIKRRIYRSCRAPASLHLRRAYEELAEEIRLQNRLIDALAAYSNPHADQMRRAAVARRDAASDTLNININQHKEA